jgi:thiol:disulfide interchange protein
MPAVDHRSQSARSRQLRIVGVACVALAIAAVLILKGYLQSSISSVAEVRSAEAGGEGVIQPVPAVDLPETQLDRLLAGSQPTLAFFHSNTCYQCVQMTGIVDRVYPEYAQSVALVDVNVYDERNGNLLRRAGIRVIPTLIFFDRQGRGQVVTGVMQPDQLRQQLQTISGGQ